MRKKNTRSFDLECIELHEKFVNTKINTRPFLLLLLLVSLRLLEIIRYYTLWTCIQHSNDSDRRWEQATGYFFISNKINRFISTYKMHFSAIFFFQRRKNILKNCKYMEIECIRQKKGCKKKNEKKHQTWDSPLGSVRIAVGSYS